MQPKRATVRIRVPSGILTGSVLVTCRYGNGKLGGAYYWPEHKDYDRLLKAMDRKKPWSWELIRPALMTMGWNEDLSPPDFNEHPLPPEMWGVTFAA